MPAASLSHGFVFVKHLEPMIRFYEGAFGMNCRQIGRASCRERV